MMKTPTKLPFLGNPGWMALACLLASLTLLPGQTQSKNIILFIGDGMGYEHVQAGRLYRSGTDTVPLSFETLPYQGRAVTKLPDGTITDSATAGTALATGYQHPANGVISMGANNAIKTTVLELAKARGLRTGLITTDSITGATPGAFGAHEPNRTYETAIRLDYLQDDTIYGHPASRPNVLFGGGYDDGSYVSLATSLGYAYAATAEQMSALQTPEFALGLFGSGWLPMDPFAMNNATQPRLPQMVNKALALLENNAGAGFFLMVEGGLIDKLSHSNDGDFTPEVTELDLAVQEALAWANQTGESLLLIVTADHETGGLNVPDGQAIAPGTYPAMTFASTGHTGVDVPVYANWPAGLQGQTIDNTEIFYLMEDYLRDGQAPQIANVIVSGVSETQATVQWTTTELSDSRVELSGVAEPFGAATRTLSHTVVCTGLQPGTTYAATVSSTDLAGYTGTAIAQFTTPSPSPDAVVKANPVVTAGELVGSVAGLATPGDGAAQSITEVQVGAGAGLQVTYTLNTRVPRSSISALALYGALAWTQKDGASDTVVAEVRVIAPEGGSYWERITLDSQIPFQASPPSSYVDANGDILIRLTDSASIRRERKDTLTVDYLIGKVETAPRSVPDPTAPANLLVTATSSASVTLTWTDSSDETGYDIWRYTDAGGWVLVNSVGENATSYTDTVLAPSTTYTYVVRAFNAQGYADSAAGVATTKAVELEMPENFIAKAGRGTISLTWTDTNAGESGYKVWRSEGGEPAVLVTLPPNSTKYTDASIQKGTTYWYQVGAFSATGTGPLSSAVQVTAR